METIDPVAILICFVGVARPSPVKNAPDVHPGRIAQTTTKSRAGLDLILELATRTAFYAGPGHILGRDGRHVTPAQQDNIRGKVRAVVYRVPPANIPKVDGDIAFIAERENILAQLGEDAHPALLASILEADGVLVQPALPVCTPLLAGELANRVLQVHFL
jgi:hypothetical protein